MAHNGSLDRFYLDGSQRAVAQRKYGYFHPLEYMTVEENFCDHVEILVRLITAIHGYYEGLIQTMTFRIVLSERRAPDVKHN